MEDPGYLFLIQRVGGGKAGFRKVSLQTLKLLADANYSIGATVKMPSGGFHEVDFRGFEQVAGKDYVVFGDPIFGCEVKLPVCDFKRIFITNNDVGAVALADFGQATPIQIGGKLFPQLR